MTAMDVTAEEGRQLAARLAAEIPAGCAIAVAGIEPTFAHQGRAVAQLTVVDRHLNQVGVVQGGVYGLFADATAGFAVMSLLAETKTFATLDMRVSLLRGARTGDVLIAEATPIHTGGTTMVLEVRVRKEGDPSLRPVAFFTCTQLVMDRQ